MSYGYPADLVLEKAFVPSLYPPEMEQKLQRLSDLASKKAAQTITADEQQEHDKLLQELAAVNPWLENLLAPSATGRGCGRIKLHRGPAPTIWTRDNIKQWTRQWLDRGCDSRRLGVATN